ncbi:hypothetical protein MBLNU230_g6040t1 [Neophaeotheca triangularis]
MSQEPRSTLLSNGSDFTPTIHHDSYDFIKPEQFNLAGKAVFIAGASRGIGRATAISYAKAGASMIGLGARSAMADLKREIQQIAGNDVQILLVKLDVASHESVDAAAQEVERAFGRLDILDINAGTLENLDHPIADSDPIGWRRVYEVNNLGPYFCTRAFLPLLLKSKQGLKTIVAVSSIAAHIAMKGASGYQTGKLALCRFCEFIMVEYGEQGIQALCIHPGGVLTDLAKASPEEYQHLWIDKPELAGDSTVWLTAVRREWLAGRYVDVTWDMAELEGKREKIVEGDLLKVRLAVGFD